MADKISAEELLYRQVHPQFYDKGILGSRAFKPNSSDAGLMSTDRASISSAAQAYEHYTVHRKKQSACVFGITVEEFNKENVQCFEDALEADGEIPANPAHSLADYNAHEAKSWKVVSQQLKLIAAARGCQFDPTAA